VKTVPLRVGPNQFFAPDQSGCTEPALSGSLGDRLEVWHADHRRSVVLHSLKSVSNQPELSDRRPKATTVSTPCREAVIEHACGAGAITITRTNYIRLPQRVKEPERRRDNRDRLAGDLTEAQTS